MAAAQARDDSHRGLPRGQIPEQQDAGARGAHASVVRRARERLSAARLLRQRNFVRGHQGHARVPLGAREHVSREGDGVRDGGAAREARQPFVHGQAFFTATRSRVSRARRRRSRATASSTYTSRR